MTKIHTINHCKLLGNEPGSFMLPSPLFSRAVTCPSQSLHRILKSNHSDPSHTLLARQLCMLAQLWISWLNAVQHLYLWTFPVSAVSATLASDKAALLTMYRTWGSPIGLSWSSPSPCDKKWTDLSCDNGVVTGLFVNNLKLNTPVDPAIGDLLGLTNLQFVAAHIVGPIPLTLSQLTNLQVLVLDINDFQGGIPPQLSTLTRLTRVSFTSNRNLGGSIPPQLSSLINLNTLMIESCSLTGGIPPQLSSLVNLRGLYLDSNQLTGEIPPALSRVYSAAAPSFYIEYNPGLCGHFISFPGIHFKGTNLGGVCVQSPSE